MNLNISPLCVNHTENNYNSKFNNNQQSKPQETLLYDQIQQIKQNQELTFKMIDSIKKKALTKQS